MRAFCPNPASAVIEKVKSVLNIVDRESLLGWPTDEQWVAILPEWFQSKCAPPMTQEQSEKWLSWWRKLSHEDKIKAENEKKWSLENWLYWMEPDNRNWFWWDANILDGGNRIILEVAVDGWPFPWGDLRWLFIAAGAYDLESEE